MSLGFRSPLLDVVLDWLSRAHSSWVEWEWRVKCGRECHHKVLLHTLSPPVFQPVPFPAHRTSPNTWSRGRRCSTDQPYGGAAFCVQT